MPSGTLVTAAMGPFTGVVDTKGSSVVLPGKLRSAKNLTFGGLNRLSVRQGSIAVLTLMDDAGTPAAVTKVLAVETFMDGAIALAHSTVTHKVYVYRLPATMDGWYDTTGALQSTLSPLPIGVVWSAITSAPDVSVAEGLGTLYLACSSAIAPGGVAFRTRQVTLSAAGVPTLSDLAASGTGGAAGADFAYFTAIASFHQHLWGVGYGVGAVAGYTSFRPELARFSQPSFGNLQTADSIVIGNRVRAIRERALALKVAGNALFLGASTALFRVTGYGRDSWFVESLDDKYGFSGPKACVSVGGTLYYWTSRGLCRCTDAGAPEPLWDAIPAAVASVANESKIVLGFDKDSDQVQVFYDTGSGVRTLCAFDTRRDTFVATAGDIGLVINCAGVVDPIYASTSSGPAAPGDPTIIGTDTFTATGARLLWTVGDALAQHELSVRQSGTVSFTVIQTTDAGISSFTASGLLPGVNYEWRIRALKNGVYGAYVGPSTDSQFATLSSSGTGTPSTAPTGLAIEVVIEGKTRVLLTWTNADPTLPIQILRSSDGATFAQVGSVAAGVSSATNDTGAFGTFYYQVRHVAADGTPGTASDVATITTTPP